MGGHIKLGFRHVKNAGGIAQSFAQARQHFAFYVNVACQIGDAEKLLEADFHQFGDEKFEPGDCLQGADGLAVPGVLKAFGLEIRESLKTTSGGVFLFQCLSPLVAVCR